MQKGLLTQSLTGPQWLACLGLALVAPVVVELDKAIRGRRRPAPEAVPVEAAVGGTLAAAPA
jgi:Ca2+-transporting ATPase